MTPLMTAAALRFMERFCASTRGTQGAGAIDALAIGEHAGLTAAETMAAIDEVARLHYVTYSTRSRAVFLADDGAAWWRRRQRATQAPHGKAFSLDDVGG